MLRLKTILTAFLFVIIASVQAHASGFGGTWVGVGTNNFGVSYDETIIINVSGSSISGSYENSQQAGTKWDMSGSVTGGGKAQATVFGLDNSVLYFTLMGNKLTYTWEWGSGELMRQ